MKIRFQASVASAVGMFTNGREYELSDELATGFIRAGHAVAGEAVSAGAGTIEEAVVTDDAGETAALPSRRPKSRK